MTVELEHLSRGDMSREGSGPAPQRQTFRVRDMSTPEHFLLVAIRNWVEAVKKKVHPIPVLSRGFTLARVPSALSSFDALMLMTATSATRPLDVRCPKCTGVGDGEIDIISTVGFAQARRNEWALQRLNAWLPPAVARQALVHVEAIASEMAAVDLTVPLRLEYLSRDLSNTGDDRGVVIAFPVHKTVQ